MKKDFESDEDVEGSYSESNEDDEEGEYSEEEEEEDSYHERKYANKRQKVNE
jgi:hypothetical protein